MACWTRGATLKCALLVVLLLAVTGSSAQVSARWEQWAQGAHRSLLDSTGAPTMAPSTFTRLFTLPQASPLHAFKGITTLVRAISLINSSQGALQHRS